MKPNSNLSKQELISLLAARDQEIHDWAADVDVLWAVIDDRTEAELRRLDRSMPKLTARQRTERCFEARLDLLWREVHFLRSYNDELLARVERSKHQPSRPMSTAVVAA
jgi:hypothetical protein